MCRSGGALLSPRIAMILPAPCVMRSPLQALQLAAAAISPSQGRVCSPLPASDCVLLSFTAAMSSFH